MRFLPFVYLAFLLLLGLPRAALAESPVSIILYKLAPASIDGFVMEYSWHMARSDDWRRFEYMATKMEPGKKEDIFPFSKKPDELLVLSVKDDDGVTGKDYYLSKDGIMVTSIYSKNRYLNDDKNFFKFLKEEITNHPSFEKFSGEKIRTDSPGIIVHYNINESLPNPSWIVNSQKNVDLYDDFLRNISFYPYGMIKQLINSRSFEQKGNFIVLLNYPEAPAKFVTVGVDGIRMSKTYSKDLFLKDDKKYYDYFYKLTKETRKINTEVQAKDQQILERGQF